MNLPAEQATGFNNSNPGSVGAAINFENAIGGASDDTFISTSDDNNFNGGAGNDTYIFDDNWGSDTVADTSGGGDTFDFSRVTTPITFTLGSIYAISGSSSATHTSNNIERLIGGAADDLFIFSANGVQFANGTGTLDGNGGVNTIDYAAYTNPVSVNLALGTATGTSGIFNFRDVIGGSGGDTLIGDGQDNILRGNGGNDSIDGGAGMDTLDESNAAVSINVDLSTTAPQNSGRGTVTYQNLEYVLTGSGNDLITSSIANNILRGGAGDDTYRFKDGWGADTVVDTAGSDTIDFVLANNGVTFNPASSEVVNGANNVTYLGIESLAGSSGDDTFNIVGALTHTLRGGAGNDAFVFADGATLTGTVDGQSGTDTLNFSNLQSPISVALTSVGSTDGFNGTDAAISGGFSNVDNLIGTSGSDTLNVSTATNTWKFEVGNLKLEVGSNSLTFSNFDTLNGSMGADTFAFANGADFVGTIDGKGGTDTLDFSAYLTGRDFVLTSVGVVDGFNLTVANISATFLNINTLIGSSATDSLTGLTSGAWAINGITNTYLQTNTLAFSAIENLIGGKRRGYICVCEWCDARERQRHP